MKRLVLAMSCGAIFLFPATLVRTQGQQVVNHGGKIKTKYDGFNHETVMRLRKMKVNCDGFRDRFKDACVSIEVTLHCPGTQLNYVRNVTLQVVFENKDWVHLHAPEQRGLAIVIDGETLNLGRMTLVSTGTPGAWDTKIERLEATIPYTAFKRIAFSESVEIQVGNTVVELREKNRIALKDLNSRVIVAATNSTSVK